MDIKEYKIALDNLPEETIAKYFNNDNSKYIQAKSQMMEIIKKTDENIPLSNQPFFTSYLIRNLLFLCKNRSDFVGSVLYANVNKKISGIAGLTGAACTTTSFLPTSKETISTAENLYQEARKKLYKIQDSSKILKKEINDILKLIEPISIAKNYKNVLQTYYVLYSELRFSLQLLYHIEDIDKTFDFNMSLAENNTQLLDVLSHTDLNLEKYSKNTFITGMNNDIKKLYSKIEQSHQGSKTQDRVSDSGSVTAKPTNVDNEAGLLGHIEDLSWDEIYQYK